MDIIDGRCVRLVRGDFARRTVYPIDPAQAAKLFEAAGVRRLHMVDLEGAVSGSLVNLDVLKCVAAATNLTIDYGGGVRTSADVRSVLEAGAAVVNIGSVAAMEPKLIASWMNEFDAGRFLVGADVRNRRIAVEGWRRDTETDLFAFLARIERLGIAEVFVTDISKDGAMAGPSIGLYREIVSAFPRLRLIASGGVRSVTDITEVEAAGCRGVIVGRALYEGEIDLKELTGRAR